MGDYKNCVRTSPSVSPGMAANCTAWVPIMGSQLKSMAFTSSHLSPPLVGSLGFLVLLLIFNHKSTPPSHAAVTCSTAQCLVMTYVASCAVVLCARQCVLVDVWDYSSFTTPRRLVSTLVLWPSTQVTLTTSDPRSHNWPSPRSHRPIHL